MTNRNSRSGLTLLETLIALAIMSMLAAMLSSGLNFGILMLDRSENLSGQVAHAVDRATLRDWIEHTLPAPMPTDNRQLFQGTATTLTFLADLAGSDPRIPAHAPALITFEPKTGTFTASGAGGPAERAELVIAAPGTRIQFEYWGRITSGQPPLWHQDWPASAGVPVLIRITFADGALPPLVVRAGKAFIQSEMSLSSLVPPALPSRP